MKIGIPAQYYGGVVGVKDDYLILLEDLGFTPIIIHPFRDVKNYDGLLLPGGTDVDSRRYSKFFPGMKCYPPDRLLEYFDTKILPDLIKAKMPIFGICRGLQTVNVHFGGTLHRDIPKTHPTSINSKAYAHEIKLNSGQKMWVNSFHHQAIHRLGKGLKSLATSDDGFIEAIRHEELPIYAVQWHPERDFSDKISRNTIKEIFE